LKAAELKTRLTTKPRSTPEQRITTLHLVDKTYQRYPEPLSNADFFNSIDPFCNANVERIGHLA